MIIGVSSSKQESNRSKFDMYRNRCVIRSIPFFLRNDLSSSVSMMILFVQWSHSSSLVGLFVIVMPVDPCFSISLRPIILSEDRDISYRCMFISGALFSDISGDDLLCVEVPVEGLLLDPWTLFSVGSLWFDARNCAAVVILSLTKILLSFSSCVIVFVQHRCC